MLHVLNVHKKFYGNNSWRITYILDDLGNIFCQLGDNTMTKKLLFKSLKIKENYYVKDNWPVAITLRELAKVCKSEGNLQQAKLFLKRAILIQENYFGKDHWQVLLTKKVLDSDFNFFNKITQLINNPNS